ncbi:SDR family oxidoreductase [Luteimonas sp. MC1750]|uniref:SDR family oxidoreductase n=1 Tax=Luteimonas sp. MC1750 TaxID=2799326 RepID=UPI0018F0973A|nr:SDR family oxidoreductase [Luteimonas sp. MC1750]MBJ6985479.1 SDR family oxidoreductase [Luteimonas sp. MC1750]QQO06033.1 SDR family oxidoreductase [Luteimonas sp. MC1750]
MDIRIRTSLVTGANRGLGLALVRHLLDRGDHVVAACREPGRATALNSLAGEHPGRLHVLPLDVADTRSRAAFVAELPLVLGNGRKVGLLLNNAGVLHSGERFGRLDEATLEHSFRVNAMGPLLLVQALAPLLADGSRVANLSSQLGSIAGCTRFGTPSYNMSKAAQNMATALLAHALADRGIAVVALHPGWVQTDMGGEQATETVDASAAGLLDVIDGLDAGDSGRFLDWRGAALPW